MAPSVLDNEGERVTSLTITRHSVLDNEGKEEGTHKQPLILNPSINLHSTCQRYNGTCHTPKLSTKDLDSKTQSLF